MEGLDQRYIFSKKTRFLFWVTHEKFQKPANFSFLFSKVFHRKGLKNGWKKVHGKSLSVRVRKNSGNFISNGPILLVWVTHDKFELEGLIWKLFTVKPRATVHFLDGCAWVAVQFNPIQSSPSRSTFFHPLSVGEQQVTCRF